MKYYELTYLISPELSEEEVKAFQEKINSLIQKEGGALESNSSTQQGMPVKKKLASPIKSKGQAYLTFLNFYLEPEKLVNLEKKLKSEGQVLRYLISTKELPKKVAAVPVKQPKRIFKPKVELKEIEKKLEEILGEP